MQKSVQARSIPEASGGGIVSGLLFMLKTVFISYVISIILLFVSALIATFGAFSDQAVSIMANVVTAIAVFFCGFLSGRHFSSKGLVFGAICGIVYALLLSLVGNLVAQKMALGSSALSAIAIGTICGAAGGVTGINTKRTRKR